jgi:hypothetical protein
LDLAVQEKYKVQFLTYWFDEARCTAFCLIVSPDKETLQKAHNEAYGLVPNEIIEVDPSLRRPSWAESATLLQWIPHPEKREKAAQGRAVGAARGAFYLDKRLWN